MRFLKPPELKAWLETCTQSFGYRSLEPEVMALYTQLVGLGQTALPAGLLARWLERLLSRVTGEHLPGRQSDSLLLDQLTQGDGFSYLSGQYGLRPPPEAELEQLVSLVFGQLPLRHPQLHFAPRELAELDQVESDPDFAATSLLQEVVASLTAHLLAQPLRLDSEDLFEIRHPLLFESPGARNLYRRLRACATEIAGWCDTHLQLEQDGPEVVKRYGQPEVLPIGGYDELTTRGDLSALLPSELALIDTNEPLDYFDFKFLHHELLYFQREEGQVFRIRRQLHIVLPLGHGLELERHLVPFLAFVLVLIQSLRAVFAKDRLQLEIWLPASRLPSSLQQGLDFLGHLLSELELAGQVSLHPGRDFRLQQAEPLRAQLWLLGPEGIEQPELNQVILSYPALDALQALSEPERLRLLGELVNTTLLGLIARAGR
ncbi:MAG TPA: hypothetical protein V6D23_13345 [Candidatus Obscuribacterales bacterium]